MVRFFSKAKYMIGVDFEILARTPVPQLPPLLPLPEFLPQEKTSFQNGGNINLEDLPYLKADPFPSDIISGYSQTQCIYRKKKKKKNNKKL